MTRAGTLEPSNSGRSRCRMTAMVRRPLFHSDQNFSRDQKRVSRTSGRRSTADRDRSQLVPPDPFARGRPEGDAADEESRQDRLRAPGPRGRPLPEKRQRRERGSGGKARQDVGRQLASGDREEDEDND